MPITQQYYSSVTCDGCGTGFDEIMYHSREEMISLRNDGWTGTIKKCFCPECSLRRRKGERLPKEAHNAAESDS